MNVLLAGATGFIGSGVLRALLSAGHDVTALVRSDVSAETVRAAGATPALGSLDSLDLVRELAAGADAVIDATSPASAAEADAFATAVLEGLGARDATFIRTGGAWVHGAGDAVTEDTPRDAPAIVAWRAPVDARMLAAPGVRSMLIEPGVVYGYGAGIPNTIVGSPVVDGALTLIGPGDQHWTTVHVDDLAALYLAVLERGAAGETYLGVGGANPTVRELGEAASRALGLEGRVIPETPADTVARLGDFGAALLVSQQADGAKARGLGWTPGRASLDALIEAGEYIA
jgi:nucleoside-diphosphate-sugar epimerase